MSKRSQVQKFTVQGYKKLRHLRLLQNCLSSPNVSIGDMVFQAVRTRFPLKIAAGMTELRLLQEAHLLCIVNSTSCKAHYELLVQDRLELTNHLPARQACEAGGTV